MKSIALIALASAVLLGVSTYFVFSHSAAQPLQFNHNDYVFYQVEIEWPGSVCKFKDCNKRDLANFNGQHFNLHGVWPTGNQQDSCKFVNNCQHLPFDNSLITSQVMTNLDQYWTGLYNPSEAFRQHEWEKHGVCWNDNSDKGYLQEENLATYMNNYFNFALDVIKRFEPLSTLSNSGIIPSDTKSYDYTTAINSLKPHFGQGTVGQCQVVDGKQYLHSVDFCLGLDYQPVDCPCSTAKKSNCKTDTPIYLGEFVMPSQ